MKMMEELEPAPMNNAPVPEAAPVRLDPKIDTDKSKKPRLNADIGSILTPIPDSPDKA